MAEAAGPAYEVGDVILATFRPARLDTLKPEAAAIVGERCRWQALWPIDAEDSEVYAGQIAWGVPTADSLAGVPHPLWDRAHLIWVPSEDLCDVAASAVPEPDRG